MLLIRNLTRQTKVMSFNNLSNTSRRIAQLWLRCRKQLAAGRKGQTEKHLHEGWIYRGRDKGRPKRAFVKIRRES